MATPNFIKNLSRNRFSRAVVCWIGAQYIRFVDISSSWIRNGEEYPIKCFKEQQPFIACFWHGRLMMMGSNWRWDNPFHMLISNHADGKLISQIIRRLGFKVLEISTKKGGADALRSMMKILQSGGSVGITPDGPHGPGMEVTIGALTLARLSGAPILPTTFSTTKRKILKTWDRFLFAQPFGKGIFLWGEPIWVPRNANEEEVEQIRQKLENELNKLTLRADKICGPTLEGTPPSPNATVFPSDDETETNK
ncbi:MAG: lysophospholipid acyltransferase family protein [Pseudomonadota bacterium]|nr:lysophospholipid acyltransferase family protein [Pseudomonadota bacterium]